MSQNRVALAELVAVDGNAVDFAPIGADLRAGSGAFPVRIEFPTDSEGPWGRRCPKCASYFRTANPMTTFCPYCDATAEPFAFLTANQRGFIKRQHDAIIAAMNGPDGDTAVNFDGDAADSWAYSEEKQQTRFKCA